GVNIAFGEGNTIIRNTISGSGKYGIAIYYTHFNSIIQNILSNIAVQDVYLGPQTESNQISGNTGASSSSSLMQQQQKTTEVKKGPRVGEAFTPAKNKTATTIISLPAAAPTAPIRLFAKGTGSGAIGSGSLRNY
ncbi:MAG TPA: right-handed parallel beta-helix repeat-containing protein, partial [Candidatus Nanoarchaeia archaeon]|nr:right-handed parallel beta-helix repeat-containing protein [Candidatus Nanoarchaeia archaeon]